MRPRLLLVAVVDEGSASRCVSLGADMPTGNAAPSGLLRLEGAIDGVRQGIAWKRPEATQEKAAEQ